MTSQARVPQRFSGAWDADQNWSRDGNNWRHRSRSVTLSDVAVLVVSWVRQRDLHILTVGKYTYTSDQRFHSIHLEGSEDWTLEVYTEPKMSLNISLAVVVAKARNPEGSNLYIQSGITINLTCVVTDTRTPQRAGIRVATERGLSTTVSRLQLPDAATGDLGNYSCILSYANPANIPVHVLNGEKPAAMQHNRQGNLAERLLSSLLHVTGVVLLHRLFTHAVELRSYAAFGLQTHAHRYGHDAKTNVLPAYPLVAV
ncbi:hypothetical protein HPB47_001321 [Ixodes persulcatus]|uniref:Uncharacterized protein n=1 Tax=Ixodes persulcatus TaxID=34615 RepID=A0AC60PPB1_IXOPE|nr:hypothetical protein HPB47_001321 [Ixodes persulcatus]